jgi:hypothetical protein
MRKLMLSTAGLPSPNRLVRPTTSMAAVGRATSAFILVHDAKGMPSFVRNLGLVCIQFALRLCIERLPSLIFWFDLVRQV